MEEELCSSLHRREAGKGEFQRRLQPALQGSFAAVLLKEALASVLPTRAGKDTRKRKRKLPVPPLRAPERRAAGN